MQPYAAYEAFIAGLVRTLVQPARATNVSFGLRNQVAGASTVRHQIDVSFVDVSRSPNRLVLIECKYLNVSLKLAHAKVLKATVDDIALVAPSRMSVHGMLVSRKGIQKGAAIYARHYGLQAQIVEDGREYDFQYDELKLVARSGSAQAASQAWAEGYGVRQCSRCGKEFRVRHLELSCPECMPLE